MEVRRRRECLSLARLSATVAGQFDGGSSQKASKRLNWSPLPFKGSAYVANELQQLDCRTSHAPTLTERIYPGAWLAILRRSKAGGGPWQTNRIDLLHSSKAAQNWT